MLTQRITQNDSENYSSEHERPHTDGGIAVAAEDVLGEGMGTKFRNRSRAISFNLLQLYIPWMQL